MKLTAKEDAAFRKAKAKRSRQRANRIMMEIERYAGMVSVFDREAGEIDPVYTKRDVQRARRELRNEVEQLCGVEYKPKGE